MSGVTVLDPPTVGARLGHPGSPVTLPAGQATLPNKSPETEELPEENPWGTKPDGGMCRIMPPKAGTMTSMSAQRGGDGVQSHRPELRRRQDLW